MGSGVAVDLAVQAFEAIAPLSGAGAWDNVGLLLRGDRSVRRVGVCIDLTEAVVDEMEAADVDLVYAYHPTVFGGLKRITGSTGIERVVLRMVRAGRHLYAPHTALDAAHEGMGDWLIGALGPVDNAAPIEVSKTNPAVGLGRHGRLRTPQTLRSLLPGIRAWLDLPQLRVAGDLDRVCETVAVCPGSGGSLFKGLGPTDLLLTGEAGHHDVLAWVAAGTAVVLTDHTNCERGFLSVLLPRLAAALPDVHFVRSTVDADPLRIV